MFSFKLSMARIGISVSIASAVVACASAGTTSVSEPDASTASPEGASSASEAGSDAEIVEGTLDQDASQCAIGSYFASGLDRIGPQCGACMQAHCCEQSTACQVDIQPAPVGLGCAEYTRCRIDCGSDYEDESVRECTDVCVTDLKKGSGYAEALEVFVRMASCATLECTQECPYPW